MGGSNFSQSLFDPAPLPSRSQSFTKRGEGGREEGGSLITSPASLLVASLLPPSLQFQRKIPSFQMSSSGRFLTERLWFTSHLFLEIETKEKCSIGWQLEAVAAAAATAAEVERRQLIAQLNKRKQPSRAGAFIQDGGRSSTSLKL